MADEQTHQTGTIDDAIRQAEKQLERRIEELRTLAGGEETAAPAPGLGAGGEPAELRPTGAMPPVEQPLTAPESAGGFVDEDAWDDEEPGANAVEAAFTPMVDPQFETTDALAHTDEGDTEGTEWEPSPSAHESGAGEWDSPAPTEEPASDDVDGGQQWELEGSEPTAWEPASSTQDESSQLGSVGADLSGGTTDDSEYTYAADAYDVPSRYQQQDSPTVEPYGPSEALAPYTSGSGFRTVATAGSPTPEETEFWTHTRTAMRLLQQQSDELRHELPNEITRRIREDVGRDMSKRMSAQLGSTLGEQMERIVRDEMASQAASIRQLQQQLPTYADRIERSVTDELQSAAANVKLLQEELPAQFQRVERSFERSLTEDMTKVTRTVEEKTAAVQAMVASQFEHIELAMRGELGKLEQFVRSEFEGPSQQLTQLQESLPGQFQRVDRSVKDSAEQSKEGLDRLGTALTEQQRQLAELTENVQMHREHLVQQIDTLSQTQREHLTKFATETSDQLSAMTKTGAEQHETLSVSMRDQLQRQTEQLSQESAVVREDLRQHQLQMAQKVTDTFSGEIASTKQNVRDLIDLDMGNALGDIAMASRLVLDKLGSMSGELDQDRLQRAEDLELIVDSLASASQGVYGAVNRLFDRVSEFNERMDTVEHRLGSISALERTVEKGLTSVFQQLEGNLTSMQHHLNELQPAPVVVTVNHPEASVAQETRAGYMIGGTRKE
jgi:hypothetical protein